MSSTPDELRAEADRLDRRARELRREAATLERQASGKRLCEGVTKSGRPCRQEARPGRPYCAHHDPDLTPAERGRILSPRWAAADPLTREGREEV
jgi:hypothetical protein